MSQAVDANKTVRNVMIEGQSVPLEGEYTVDEARKLLMDMGIASNIQNANPVLVTPDTVEFVNQRGKNG